MKRNTARKSTAGIVQKSLAGFMCKECGIIFHQKSDWQEHKSVFHDPNEVGRRYVCMECGSCFDSYFQLKEHDTAHALTELMSTVEKGTTAREPKAQKSATKVEKDKPGESSQKSGAPGSSEECRRSVVPVPGPANSISDSFQTSFGNFAKRTKLAEQLSLPLPVPVARKVPVVRSAGGSACPVCGQEFANASIMLEHTVVGHSAELLQLEAKVYNNQEVIETRRFVNVLSCLYCNRDFLRETDCLLHMFSKHRQQLYLGVTGAEKIFLTVEVALRRGNGRPNGFIFKVNVTVNLKPKPAR